MEPEVVTPNVVQPDELATLSRLHRLLTATQFRFTQVGLAQTVWTTSVAPVAVAVALAVATVEPWEAVEAKLWATEATAV